LQCIEHKSPTKLSSSEAIRHHFFGQPFLTHGPGATVVKRSMFHSIGGFPLEYSIAGDMYYNLNSASQTGVLLLPFRFLNYRIHEGQELNNKFDYLWANYNYLRDALQNLQLPLTIHEKKWLMNKNRRRFLINSIRFMSQELDLGRLRYLFKKTDFGFNDLVKAIFHKGL